jgi:dihydrodipicolinate synthase/N-acetylneuraminate lyase
LSGASAVVLTYGDSLFTLLSETEIATLTKKCVELVNKRALLVAATGMWSLPQTKEFAAYSAKVGADLLMVMPPDWESSCSVQNLVHHFASAGQHIPVMVADNFLLRRSEAFALQLIQKLYEEVPQVVALKDDVTGSLIRKICLLTSERWALIAGGQKENHINMIPYGVDGYFSLLCTFNPSVSRQYWNYIQANRIPNAVSIANEFDIPVFKYLLASDGGFDAGIHGMLELAGLGKRYRREPYHSLNDHQMEMLKEFLKAKEYLG